MSTAGTDNKTFTDSVKRMTDIAVSAVFLLTVFPLVALVLGAAIKITMPGPVFFRQKRTGRDGRTFVCYKFRSMVVNSVCDSLQARKGDCRITRLGSFLRNSSLDELPQFFNVLRGDMSLVGPRPHMLRHTEYYTPLIDGYERRHAVRPGITGWAQINDSRGETPQLSDMQRRIDLDLWYIRHRSFSLDCVILLRTLRMMLRL